MSKPLVVPPRSCVVIQGQTRVQSLSQRISVCLEETKEQSVTRGVVVSPCLHNLLPDTSSKLMVQVVIHLDHEVSIPVKARICDLYSTEDVISLNSAVTMDQSSETG